MDEDNTCKVCGEAFPSMGKLGSHARWKHNSKKVSKNAGKLSGDSKGESMTVKPTAVASMQSTAPNVGIMPVSMPEPQYRYTPPAPAPKPAQQPESIWGQLAKEFVKEGVGMVKQHLTQKHEEKMALYAAQKGPSILEIAGAEGYKKYVSQLSSESGKAAGKALGKRAISIQKEEERITDEIDQDTEMGRKKAEYERLIQEMKERKAEYERKIAKIRSVNAKMQEALDAYLATKQPAPVIKTEAGIPIHK